MKNQYNDASLGMKDLVEASGTHRQTIYGYLRKGLLPPPVDATETRNAHYTRQHLELLKFIRQLRSGHGFSLNSIKKYFIEAEFDPLRVHLALRRDPAFQEMPGFPPLVIEHSSLRSPEEMIAFTQASPELFEALLNEQLIAPEPSDIRRRFTSEAQEILLAAHEAERRGLLRRSVLRLAQLASAMAHVEVAALATQATRTDNPVEVMCERAQQTFHSVSRLVSTIRQSQLTNTLRLLASTTPSRNLIAEGIYIPSKLFIQRYQFDRLLKSAEEATSQDDQDAEATLHLGHLLLTLGRYEEATGWLEITTRTAPSSAEAHAFLGMTLAICGRERAGLSNTRRAIALQPQSPRVNIFHSAVLGMCAMVTTGLSASSQLMQEALTSSLSALHMPPSDVREEMEVLLACGRALTYLSRKSKGFTDGIAALDEVLQRTQLNTQPNTQPSLLNSKASSPVSPGASGASPKLPSKIADTAWNAYYRMSALFFLGVALAHDNPPRAAALLRESIVLDPTSNLAEKAFLLLPQLEA